METSISQEFSFSLPLDNGLLRQSVMAGEPIDLAEVLSLAAMAQALFISVTLESRTLEWVNECYELWAEAARLFGELCDSWAGVESGEQSIAWLRGQLTHYHELCEDRMSLYSEGRARRQYVRQKAQDSLG
jgi:hypothetical protein